MSEEASFDLYWRHFDMTKDEYIGWLIISFHFSHFCKFNTINISLNQISVLLWLCWNRENCQILIFTFLGCLMLYAEKLNELLAQQKWISRQNYFDSSGMFFTIVIGAPGKVFQIIHKSQEIYQTMNMCLNGPFRMSHS